MCKGVLAYRLALKAEQLEAQGLVLTVQRRKLVPEPIII